MLQKIVFVGVLLLTLSAHGTAGGPGDDTSGKDNSIELKVGESASLSQVKITFTRVESDSRCPKGTHCFWEGEAIVVLNIRSGGASKEIKLSTLDRPSPGSGLTSSADLDSGQIILISLTPHPVGGQPPIDPGTYVLSVKTKP